MTREPDPTAFEAIVASWRAEGDVPEWPDDQPAADSSAGPRAAPLRAGFGPDAERPTSGPASDRPGVEDEGATADRSEPAGAERIGPSERSAQQAGPAPDPLVEEHFVPPEPPPLPRLGPPILVGLMLIGLGLVLITFPGWVGVPQVYGLPLGLVAVAAGLGWLVLRLWPDRDDVPPPLYLDDPDDPDGGAVL